MSLSSTSDLSPSSPNLSLLFSQLLSSDSSLRLAAHRELLSLLERPSSSLLLLHFLTSAFPLEQRLSAAIALKNFLLQKWAPTGDPPEGAEKVSGGISESDRALLKRHLPSVTLQLGPADLPIQKQLCQSISIICKTDFPLMWPSLLPDLLLHFKKRMGSEEKNGEEAHQCVMGVLETLHSILYRYRHEMRSDTLFTEIQYVLDNLAEHLTSFFIQTVENVTLMLNGIHANASANVDVDLITRAFMRLHLTLEIFLSLNTQDLPAYFEDHMEQWFKPFQWLLTVQISRIFDPLHLSDSPAVVKLLSVVDECQAIVCDSALLYASKYEEEFQPYAAAFVQLVWQRLISLGVEERFDILTTTAIRFLTAVLSKPFNRELFEDPQAMTAIVTQIVIPQIHLRASDVSMFADDPIEWIRREIEGSDVDTRRRVTVDLLRGLHNAFPNETVTLVSGYVQQLLSQYVQDKNNAWLSKDAAIFILLALSTKGATRAAGITQVTEGVDVLSFFTQQVLPELTDDRLDHLPILKADCLKFVAAFRSQLNADHLLQLLPLVSRFLSARSTVLHTYSAYAVEKILTVKDESGALKLPRAPLQLSALSLLQALLKVSHEDEHNEYVLLALLRVIELAGESLRPNAQLVLTQLVSILAQVSRNPSHPQFNHHLFNAIAALIHACCTKDMDGSSNALLLAMFESILFPVFQEILGSEHGLDFSSYCFQILAQLLEHRVSCTPAYLSIFPSVIAPTFYEQSSTLPAATRFVQAFLRAQILSVQPQQLQPILGVFSKLHSLRKHHVLGLQLLGTIFATTLLSVLQPYLTSIWQIIFTKCQGKPGTVYMSALVICLSVFVLKHSGDSLLTAFEAVQNGISIALCKSVIVPNVLHVPCRGERKYERNIALVGLSDLLFSTTTWSSNIALKAVWPDLLCRVILLHDLPSQGLLLSIADKDAWSDDCNNTNADHIPDLSGADSFARLSHAVPPSSDWSSSVTNNAPEYFEGKLKAWISNNGSATLSASLKQADSLTDDEKVSVTQWLTNRKLLQ